MDAFDITGISKSPAIFDLEKLNYFNSTYLKQLPPETFADFLRDVRDFLFAGHRWAVWAAAVPIAAVLWIVRRRRRN